MRKHSSLFRASIFAALLAFGFSSAARAASSDDNRPKVRAITAFIALDRANYQTQIAETLASLKKIKAAYEKAGFEVQTLRITTQPFPEYTRNLSDEQTLAFFKQYDALAEKDGFDAAIGPAIGPAANRATSDASDDSHEALLLAKIIASTKILEGSVVIASDDGIHWNAIRSAAAVIHYLADNSPNSLGNFRFAAIAMVPANTPFYPASYQMNGNHTFAVGLQSANVVATALASTTDPQKAQRAIEESLGKWTHQIEAIGKRGAQQTGWRYTGIDLSPAPLKEISIGGAIENFTRQPLGSNGTLAAVAIITRALKNIRVTRTGYSGLMLPVLEDSVIARRWSEGRLSLNSLLLDSAVCGTGLDVIPMPGDTTEAEIEPILKDVASLAYKWHKPLAARLLPVKGKKAGEQTEFQDPFLVNATIQPIR
ncbi:MAG TPA: DUF711 family protein [Candidatus Acidoferrales bacterium]|nr:DUF711 family protein [Candidatus Acidoferrales bacterium]